uniref:Uncharacterized protein n=1 Tax=Arundo donax TaxID=35708 RepID=A0A0A8ZS69_ARUDO
MKIQHCREHLISCIGFIDPALVHQDLVKEKPGYTENYLLKCLYHYQNKTFVLLPYLFKYVCASAFYFYVYLDSNSNFPCDNFVQFSLDPAPHQSEFEHDCCVGPTKERQDTIPRPHQCAK